MVGIGYWLEYFAVLRDKSGFNESLCGTLVVTLQVMDVAEANKFGEKLDDFLFSHVTAFVLDNCVNHGIGIGY